MESDAIRGVRIEQGEVDVIAHHLVPVVGEVVDAARARHQLVAHEPARAL